MRGLSLCLPCYHKQPSTYCGVTHQGAFGIILPAILPSARTAQKDTPQRVGEERILGVRFEELAVAVRHVLHAVAETLLEGLMEDLSAVDLGAALQRIVGQHQREGVLRCVVRGVARCSAQQGIEVAELVPAGQIPRSHLLLGRPPHAVDATEDGEGQDDFLVAVATKGIASQIRYGAEGVGFLSELLGIELPVRERY